MSKKNSMSSYNETHLLLSLGLLAILVILPTFYGIGPNSTACSVSLASASTSASSSATLTEAKPDGLPNLFIPSAIPILADKKLEISLKPKQQQKKVVEKELEAPKEEPKEQKLVEKTPENKKPEMAKVYFGFNSFTLPAQVKKDLQVMVDFLKQNESSKIGLKGYHDNVGADYVVYNQRIAIKRAQQVYNFLIAQGISANRVILKKPGKSLGSGANWEARRVEVFILE